jgi:MFS superfamily sulfate permease-like transporter
MEKKPGVFQGLNWLDWLLAALFTAIVALLVQSFFPPYGWAIGIVAATGLLYLAKRKRDRLKEQ